MAKTVFSGREVAQLAAIYHIPSSSHFLLRQGVKHHLYYAHRTPAVSPGWTFNLTPPAKYPKLVNWFPKYAGILFHCSWDR